MASTAREGADYTLVTTFDGISAISMPTSVISPTLHSTSTASTAMATASRTAQIQAVSQSAVHFVGEVSACSPVTISWDGVVRARLESLLTTQTDLTLPVFVTVVAQDTLASDFQLTNASWSVHEDTSVSWNVDVAPGRFVHAQMCAPR